MSNKIWRSMAVMTAALAAVWGTGCGSGHATSEAGHANHSHATTETKTPRDPNRLWCAEHNTYEDECAICHPELKRSADDGHGHHSSGGHAHNHGAHAEDSADGSPLMCAEHRLPEAECGNCQPDALSSIPVGKGLKVRFASAESTTRAGVLLGQPASAAVGVSHELLGQVSFNRNRFAALTTLVPGVVAEVHKDVGERVTEGEVAAYVQSPDMAQVVSEYRKAIAEARLAAQSLSREKDLFEKQISARQDLEAAQAASSVSQSAVNEARQRLLNLGLTQTEIDAAARGGAVDSVLPVRAPFEGTIIERSAVRGAAVEPGSALYQIADLTTMWMNLSVPESQLAAVSTGLRIQARFDAYPESVFEGTIVWIAPLVDPQTRLLQARAVLENADGKLKDGMFGRVQLAGLERQAEVTVPADAVQDIDGASVVFRKLEDDLFETRRVEVGPAAQGRIVVLAGLAPEEEIVIEGSYIVKSELLKARLGAGCAEH